MPKKWIVGAAAVFVALAVTGIGFATFSSTVYINGQAGAGTELLTIHDLHAGLPSCAKVTTLTSGPSNLPYPGVAGNTLFFNVSNMYSGESCTVDYNLTNIGTLPANITATIVSPSSPYTGFCISSPYLNCIQYYDALNINFETGVLVSHWSVINGNLAPGGTLSLSATFYLPAGSTSGPSSVSLVETITGTYGT